MGVEVHPDVKILAAYADGKLPFAEADGVSSHLACCPACREAIQGVPDDDRLVVLLRSLPPELRPSEQHDFPEALLGHPRYEVLEEIGRGGMGVVYKARHRILGRPVAVKLVRDPADAAAATRFLREARAAAGLDHPNVVRVHEAEEYAGLLLLVMEFVEGTDLARLLRDRGSLPVAEACDYVRQAALGLQHAHERGMVHRDAKPSNLILTPGGIVKILDFGLASLLGEDTPTEAAGGEETPHGGSLTVIRGRGMGTPDYVAPEQAIDAALADIRSDIYSLGCTLFHLLAGTAPFGQGDVSRRVLGHLLETPKPIREFRTEVSAALALVVATMMCKDPAGRYRTPAEVAAALTPFASPRRFGRRRFLAAAAAAAGVAAWWLAAARKARIVRLIEAGHAAQSLVFAGGGSLLLGGCDDGFVRAWDVDSGKEVFRWKAHAGWILGLAGMPGGRVATAGSDCTLGVWQVATGRQIARLAGHGASATCVSASPDGGRLLSGSDDKTARHWDAGTGQELAIFGGHGGPVQRATFSPGSELALTAGNDQKVRVWDPATGRVVRLHEGHTDVVTDAVFGPDGRVYSGSYDRTLRVWDGTGEAARLDLPLRPARVFQIGGRVLAVGTDKEGGCRVYDGAGAESCRVTRHAAEVVSVAVSPDGRTAATGDRSGRVVVWELPAAK